MPTSLNRIAVVAATIVLLGGGAITVPAEALADPVAGVTCAIGSYAAQFSPAVTTSPQNINVHVSYRFSGCLSAAEPLLTSGSVDYNISRSNFTCLNFVDTFQTSYTIYWNTGQSSTVDITGLTIAETTLTTGQVTAGLFAGQPITVAVQGLSTQPVQCFTTGLTSYSGIMALDVT